MAVLNSVIKRLDKLKSDPKIFVNKHDESTSNKKTLTTLEQCYGLLVSRKSINASDANDNSLDKLFVEGFDEEQIWQQLELKVNSFSTFLPNIAKLHLASDLYFPFLKPDNANESTTDKELPLKNDSQDLEKYEQESEMSESDVESEAELENNPEMGVESKKKVPVLLRKQNEPKSEVDDGFFKLSEMEQFLDKMEKEEMSGDDIDYFEDVPSDDEDDLKDAKYDDFFRRPGTEDEVDDDEGMDGIDEEEDEEGSMDEDDSSNAKKKVRFMQDDDSDGEGDSDEGNDNDEKTTFEQRETKLRQKISKLEDSNLSEKPWAYKGEVNATSRPVNSLLEEVLDVDLTVRPPPVITERVTLTLEQIIMNRIKDFAYDDVERKIKPVHVPYELKKELVLNQEKSKFSLAEIYEQEFLKRQPDVETPEEKNKLTPEKEKILKMMKSVFHKLDILSNFHYTPKPVSADIEIVSNMPAITMEEVTPVAMSDANLLAPQEVGDKTKRQLLGKDERTKTDKKRERRKKKAFLSHKFKSSSKKEDKLKSALKSRNVSLAVPTGDSTLKSSSTFFKKLQENKEVGIKVKKKTKTTG